MESNKEDASRCLEIARRALKEGDSAKALKFAEKSQRIFPTSAAEEVMQAARTGTHFTSTNSRTSANHSAGASAPNGTTRTTSQPHQPGSGGSGEQRSAVQNILRTSNYYDVLGIPKNASDDDIKKAYRKLALKLHPDKNKAPNADEAFKKVSKAFDCLSNGDKRADYDRYGSEEPRSQGIRRPGGFSRQAGEEIDPFEVFNMFFGGGMGGMGGPGVRFHTRGFGHPQQRRQQQQQQHHQQHAQQMDGVNWRNLMQLLPLLMLFIFTFWPNQQEAVYSLKRAEPFTTERRTKNMEVKFYVRDARKFDEQYAPGTERRLRLDQQAEYEYRDFLENNCSYERLQQKRLYRFGDKQKAREMHLPHCDELSKW
mmetsp:Transcript_27771/g.38377  ORF Transcript_27771/g.38377 Transcript_27771/m.38377 type:complete len:369 (-) Transcript_27771:497-1603(-)|eukprot:CAMPEP_0196592244 /NCGR_PEP_ID=MMETSP1081-20130531/72176_1 /TAXON_ID=36882 /ORGANISM="Pyramimonas amylifera, Strain CCMP720" /LENGTH=368 /DNA_ID=CAMNT_0041915859 /DNA_START=134 /DNA_END=1237 /DNA_ORIENTATION=+